MSWIELKNLQTISLKDIPVLPVEKFRTAVIDKLNSGNRILQMFGAQEPGNKIVCYAVLADDNVSKIYISSTIFCEVRTYPSITPDIPSAHLFEREFYEQFGIEPEGHPWLKPVRKGIAGIDASEKQYNFFKMQGEEVHEVGVGPVHAGIIEPGHFRFSCHGEKIYHLEIRHGFQHRGVEYLFVKNNGRPLYLLKLAESIAGDTVVGHSGTFARAIEALSDTFVSKKARYIRSIMNELERIANHLGDLSALSNDVAYLTGSAAFGALRTKVINTSMAVCGSRFGRSLVSYGGVNFDISRELASKILSTIKELSDDVSLASEVLFTSASVMERFEKTGIVDKATSQRIGLVGPAARASGSSVDIRSDHPYGSYEYFPVHKLTLDGGDVFCRAYIRFIEIEQSIKIITELLENLPTGSPYSTITQNLLKPGAMVISLTEGWRGEISHIVITDDSGNIKKVKIKDPSFNNWFAVALAVREEGISDFPLCNKSFNLSYSGFDL